MFVSRHLLWFFIVAFIVSGSAAQGKFFVKVSHDTIQMDQVLNIEFVIENLEGEFTPPDFSDFTVASGPMTSSQFSSINGKVSQKKSLTYVIIPKETGDITIGHAILFNKEQHYETAPVDIYVLSHDSSYQPKRKQHRIIENPNATPSKKRMLKRI
jgi:hypothetical protein